MSDDVIQLANGTDVPKCAVDALYEYESVWPGATFPLARAGIAVKFEMPLTFTLGDREGARQITDAIIAVLKHEDVI